MNPDLSPTEIAQQLTRRSFIKRGSTGLGATALTGLLQRDSSAASALNGGIPHVPARAKSIIYLHMVGAPSQLDLFDYKPDLVKHDGELLPKELLEGQRFAFLRGHPRLMGTPFEFKKNGNSGLEISSLLPHLSTIADDLTVVKSLHTEQFNHGPAQVFMQTGFGRFGRPSFGSWLSYGLGSENENLPTFVVLQTGNAPGAGNSLWSSGFLPSVHQGVKFRNQGDPVAFLSDPPGVNRQARRGIVDSVNELNQAQYADVGDPEISTRISQYEMAFRMQTAVPDLVDLKSEPDYIHEMYGTKPGKESFANNCLLARRLVERGVRFVQLYDADWDHHGSIGKRLPEKCRSVDQAMTALVKDLKMRGMLDDTIVIWGGEFGRTPMLQGNNGEGKKTAAGRDHHKDAFSMWMAGGGLKPGISYGKTDDLGFHVVENKVHIHDLNATLMHCMGIDHERLTFRFQGRDYRLTDVDGHVVQGILA